MDFQMYFREQASIHPSMQPQDAVKLCYQAAFGGEHILSDLAVAERYFNAEFDGLKPAEGVLYERISKDICRVNMAAWKKRGLPSLWLFRLFCLSSEMQKGSEEDFEANLLSVSSCLDALSFREADWQAFLTLYREKGGGAVHHSEMYREKEHPAYRLMRYELLSLLPLLEKVQKILTEKGNDAPFVLAIDGRAGAGKSTLASRLARVLSPASLVYMDDFFLPPALRTPERLQEKGGNLHYERFSQEVLPFLKEKEAFSYRIFDCSVMELCGERKVDAAPIRIVEGSYSSHPHFSDYADLRLFVDVAPDEQIRRILARNGDKMAELFKTRWIPMEEAYFNAFEIRGKADLVFIV